MRQRMKPRQELRVADRPDIDIQMTRRRTDIAIRIAKEVRVRIEYLKEPELQYRQNKADTDKVPVGTYSPNIFPVGKPGKISCSGLLMHGLQIVVVNVIEAWILLLHFASPYPAAYI